VKWRIKPQFSRHQSPGLLAGIGAADGRAYNASAFEAGWGGAV
jgi:hypothetical protein